MAQTVPGLSHSLISASANRTGAGGASGSPFTPMPSLLFPNPSSYSTQPPSVLGIPSSRIPLVPTGPATATRTLPGQLPTSTVAPPMATPGGGGAINFGNLASLPGRIYDWLGNPKNAMNLTTWFDRAMLEPGFLAKSSLKPLADLAGLVSGGGGSAVTTPGFDSKLFQQLIAGTKPIGTGLPNVPVTAPGGMSKAQQQMLAQILAMGNVKTGAPPVQTVDPTLITPPGIDPNLQKNINTESGNISALQNVPFLDYLKSAAQQEGLVSGPQLAQLQGQGQSDLNTISTYARGTMNALSQLPAQIGGYYNQAMNVDRDVNRGIASSLAMNNPIASESNLGIAPGNTLSSQANESFNTAGKVLAGMGGFNLTDLASNKAAQQTYAAELPNLVQEAGQQQLAASAIGTQTAESKVIASANAQIIKLANGMKADDIREAGQDITVRGQDQSTLNTQTKNRQDVLNEDANRTQQAAKDTADNVYKSIQAGQAQTRIVQAQQAHMFSVYKSLYPTQKTSTVAAAASKDLDWLQQRAGTSKPTYVRAQIGTNKDGKAIYGNVATWSNQGSYSETLRQYQLMHPEMNLAQAEQNLNTVYQIGYGVDASDPASNAERPFDPAMLAALQKYGPTVLPEGNGIQGVPDSFYQTGWNPNAKWTKKLGSNRGMAYITGTQAMALARGGLGWWVKQNTTPNHQDPNASNDFNRYNPSGRVFVITPYK